MKADDLYQKQSWSPHSSPENICQGGLLTYSLPHYDHIPLHRLWAFTTLQDDLSLSEHSHILDCLECHLALRTCLKNETFGAVLRELKLDDDSPTTLKAS